MFRDVSWEHPSAAEPSEHDKSEERRQPIAGLLPMLAFAGYTSRGVPDAIEPAGDVAMSRLVDRRRDETGIKRRSGVRESPWRGNVRAEAAQGSVTGTAGGFPTRDLFAGAPHRRRRGSIRRARCPQGRAAPGRAPMTRSSPSFGMISGESACAIATTTSVSARRRQDEMRRARHRRRARRSSFPSLKRSESFWRARSSRVGARSAVCIEGVTRSTTITGGFASAKGEGSRSQAGPATAITQRSHAEQGACCGVTSERASSPSSRNCREFGIEHGLHCSPTSERRPCEVPDPERRQQEQQPRRSQEVEGGERVDHVE